jgi:hypothetical protein
VRSLLNKANAVRCGALRATVYLSISARTSRLATRVSCKSTVL